VLQRTAELEEWNKELKNQSLTQDNKERELEELHKNTQAELDVLRETLKNHEKVQKQFNQRKTFLEKYEKQIEEDYLEFIVMADNREQDLRKREEDIEQRETQAEAVEKIQDVRKKKLDQRQKRITNKEARLKLHYERSKL